jgi:general secretion pathway protein G
MLRERQATGERRTLAALAQVRPLVERYLLENDGKCPLLLKDVLAKTKISELPQDGWGQPLRLVCPSERAEVDYILMSDGPDGLPGGLDRIEF